MDSTKKKQEIERQKREGSQIANDILEIIRAINIEFFVNRLYVHRNENKIIYIKIH